jgi:hypothetical protein
MVRFTWRRDINKKAKIMVNAPCHVFSLVLFTRDYVEESEIPERV